jgi:hypothetical protein
MKYLRIATSLFLLLFTTLAFADSGGQKSFDQLKSLSGSWEGKGSEGQPLQVSFRVTSAGSAILNEIQGPEDMVTMFHMDGDRMMMTHYCATGNQPRMVGTLSPDAKTMTFTFLDVTNFVSTQPGHMQGLVLTFVDANHHTEDWTFLDKDGQTQHHEHFDLHRKP